MQGHRATVRGLRQLKAGGRSADIDLHWDQRFESAILCRLVPLVDLAGITPETEGPMKLFKGMYPKLALVALFVSLAIASGAAKKWA